MLDTKENFVRKELTKVREKSFSSKEIFPSSKTLRTDSLNLGIVLIHLTRSSGKTHSALRTRSQWTVPWGLTAGVSNVQDYPQSSIRRVGYQSTVAVDEYQVPLVNPMVKAFRTFLQRQMRHFWDNKTMPEQTMIRKMSRDNRWFNARGYIFFLWKLWSMMN